MVLVIGRARYKTFHAGTEFQPEGWSCSPKSKKQNEVKHDLKKKIGPTSPVSQIQTTKLQVTISTGWQLERFIALRMPISRLPENNLLIIYKQWFKQGTREYEFKHKYEIVDNIEAVSRKWVLVSRVHPGQFSRCIRVRYPPPHASQPHSCRRPDKPKRRLRFPYAALPGSMFKVRALPIRRL
jgi:hypothetical protein